MGNLKKNCEFEQNLLTKQEFLNSYTPKVMKFRLDTKIFFKYLFLSFRVLFIKKTSKVVLHYFFNVVIQFKTVFNLLLKKKVDKKKIF